MPYFEVPKDPNSILPVEKFPPLEWFTRRESLQAIEIPAKETSQWRKTFQSILLKRPKVSPIVTPSNDQTKRSLLVDPLKTDEASKLLQEHSQLPTTTHELTKVYKDWSADEVLKALLPLREIPSSFERIGGLAHVNLKEDQLPFQYMIGKVLLEKNNLKTVVTKEGTIENEFRTFPMKVIAGYDGNGWSLVEVKEGGCCFQLDFQHVYWN